MKMTLKFLTIAVAAFSLAGGYAFALTQAYAASNAAAAPDIRDIRGPKPVPSPWLWVAGAACGLAAGALACGIWRWKQRSVDRMKLPFEIALERLEEARALLHPGTAREFSFAVSEVVRDYIEERFHVRAARRTTEEFLHDLAQPSDTVLGGHRDLLADFLHHCDLAKFARWILSEEEMETMLQSARNFVTETARPAPAPTTVNQGQAV